MRTGAAVPSALALLALLAAIAAHGRGTSELPSPPPPTGLAAPSDQDLNVWGRATAQHGHWHLPGVRNLDPAVFGTVAEPLGTEFMLGVPLYDRLDDGMGNWTTTALPGAESNVILDLNHHASAELSVRDRTPVDLPLYTSTTFDEVSFQCHFVDPFGREIEITAVQALPKGPFHQFFGGVATNTFLHGRTGIGGKTLPQTFAYLAIFALGEIRIDGVLLPGNDKRLVHVMVCHGVQSSENDPGPAGGSGPFLGTDAEVDPNDLEMHVHLPPVRFLPHPLPNAPVYGVGQDFVHVMFEDVVLLGSTIQGTLQR